MVEISRRKLALLLSTALVPVRAPAVVAPPEMPATYWRELAIERERQAMAQRREEMLHP